MDIQTATKGYLDTRKRLETNFNNPNFISDALYKMGIYLSHIGDHLGKLKAQYEQDRASSFLSHLSNGESASKAENLARVDTAEVRGQIAKLELTLKNGQSLVSIGQSRLRVLEGEARNQI
ncbi:hypothetical protein KC963_01420 [Candidatus Saccharibacteria bacterium]|nr:hypothetical protein [Candidatus Saccharibacteria bacterium]